MVILAKFDRKLVILKCIIILFVLTLIALLHSVLPSTKHENPWTNPIHFLTDQLPRRADGFIDGNED